LIEQIKQSGKWETVLQQSIRGTGVKPNDIGKVLVPQSKHYSWVKAMDVLGLGQQNLINIKVNDNYRLDIVHLKQTFDDLVNKRIPILAVIGVVGSTEEGAVDEIHEIINLRHQYEKQGLAFYLHLDAAFGGYARSLFLDKDNLFLDLKDLRPALQGENILQTASHWPSQDVYHAFKAMSEADSITIDPHKLGYVPYATGAVVFKDKRVLDLISYFASYVFEKDESNPLLLGSYIMEGSKAGATVAAAWLAHRVVPLNKTGYGKIIGAAIEGAQKFYLSLLSAPPLEFRDKNFIVYPLSAPDLNMVDFAFNEASNKNLAAMNALNRKIYELCSYKSGPVYDSDFITSKTELTQQEYGDTPLSFLAKFDIPAAEWHREKKVFVLRSCVMTPYLASNITYEKYWFNFIRTMWKNLKKTYSKILVNDNAEQSPHAD
jgi:glutamate/tyrosine decarboxylase-like PLP-dependent enzyme